MPPKEFTHSMKEEHGTTGNQSSSTQSWTSDKHSGRLGRLLLSAVVLVICFSMPLVHLVQFAVTAEFHSYILLVPFVSFYLVWLRRQSFSDPSEPVPQRAVVPLVAGTTALVGWWFSVHSAGKLTEDDVLALITLSFVLFFTGVCCLFLGKETLRAIVFPIGFLFFMVPFPTFLRDGVMTFLQHGSAAMAYWLFQLSGMPVFRHDMGLELPGFSMEVAPECSGIQSSLVLFLTSLLAGHLFLRTPWKRAVLAIAVIPLGILRNAFRIFTIGQLCVHIGPQMIHSAIHVRGGPVFFALSLVPFFLVLVVLYKSDRAARTIHPKPTGA
jgi:exosortase C (VPDSG-CTERM-specific)